MFNSKNLRITTIVAIVVMLAADYLCSSENEGDGVKMELIRIPAGSFYMGSPSSEKGREDDEEPRHQVRITEPFYMLTTEVTQQQYIQIMGHNPSVFKGADNPVEMVSWNDAVEFCRKLSRKTGRKITLPTEAQWEYACRADTDTKFSFSEDDQFLESFCWYGVNSGWKTHPVATKKANSWGLYDMHGNVQEWCSDRFDSHYYSNSPSVNPKGPLNGQPDLRVYRGGAHPHVADFCRSATRRGSTPDDLGGVIGFRVVFPARADDSKKFISINLATEADKMIIKPVQGLSHGRLIISGTVKDRMDIPVEGFEIKMLPIRDWRFSKHRVGRFDAEWWPPNSTKQMSVHHLIIQHMRRNLAVGMEINEDVRILDVKIKPGVILSGKVVDPDGNGIEGAMVVIKLQTSNWFERHLSWLKTDTEGRFDFRALPPGYDYVLSASKMHYRVGRLEVPSDSVSNNHIDGISIVLPKGKFSVSGVVVDSKGKPVSNALIYCAGKGQAGINSRTGADGKFKADGIFEGQVEIIANIKQDNGKWLSGSIKTKAGATDVKVVLGTGGAPPPKGRTCFPADIDVWINGEIVLISDVVVGQTIGEYGCSVPTVSFGQIEKVEEHEGTFECRDILLENGNRVGVIDAHCFMLDSGKWIAAQDLRSGQRLKTLNGAVTIKSIKIRERPYVGKVYNLKIKNSDQYIIGKDGVIVRDY